MCETRFFFLQVCLFDSGDIMLEKVSAARGSFTIRTVLCTYLKTAAFTPSSAGRGSKNEMVETYSIS